MRQIDEERERRRAKKEEEIRALLLCPISLYHLIRTRGGVRSLPSALEAVRLCLLSKTMAETKKETPPEGIVPIQMTLKQMKERYDVMIGDRLSDTVPFKVLNKTELLDEITKVGFYSAFHPVQEKLKVNQMLLLLPF